MNRETKAQIANTLLVAARALVASSHKRAAKVKAYGDKKLVGKGVRLSYDSHGNFHLEELPAKGKKKLRTIHLGGLPAHMYGDAFIPENIFRSQGVSARDDYDSMKAKITQGIKAAMSEKGMDLNRYGATPQNDTLVHYLKVEPENTEPFKVPGKDFILNLSWTKFSAYSPDSDLQLSDPYYTQVYSSSATDARKLYQALSYMPDAIRRMDFDTFREWLGKNGVKSKLSFSNWS